jgi:tRNA1(Val) A37 N6-methylase TrmN6
VAAAARVLSADGCLVVCGDARAPHRIAQACLQSGLSLHAQCDVSPRFGRPPLFSVFTLGRGHAGEPVRSLFVARTETGARTEQYLALREAFGMPRPRAEPPSP